VVDWFGAKRTLPGRRFFGIFHFWLQCCCAKMRKTRRFVKKSAIFDERRVECVCAPYGARIPGGVAASRREKIFFFYNNGLFYFT
jgi:hypothetical protein